MGRRGQCAHLTALKSAYTSRLFPALGHSKNTSSGRQKATAIVPHSRALCLPAPTPRSPLALPLLTQLVKVGLGTTGTGHRADQPGLEEGAPLVHQHPLAASVVLWVGGQGQPRSQRTALLPSFPLTLRAEAGAWVSHPCLSFPTSEGGGKLGKRQCSKDFIALTVPSPLSPHRHGPRG